MLIHIRLRSVIIGLLAAAIALWAGCEQQEQRGPQQQTQTQAVGLYVDAMVHQEAEEWDQAIQKLIAAIELYPEFTMAYSLQGDIYRQITDFEKSADAYEIAAQMDPWSFKDFFNLGKVCRIMEKFVRAVRAFLRACELGPDHFEAHLNAAQVFFALKDYDQAMAFSQMAKQIDPNRSDPEHLIGNIHEAGENHTEAIAAYKRALEIGDNTPRVVVSLARVYLKTSQFDIARELLTSAVEIQPQNAVAYRHLGFAHLKLHDLDTAIANYEKSVAINKNDWETQKALGVAYMIKAMNNNNDKTLRVIDNDEVRTLKAKAIKHWSVSLGIKSDQPKLLNFLRKYSN